MVYTTQEVKSFLQKVRIFNPSFGDLVEFYQDEKMIVRVNLENGRLWIKPKELDSARSFTLSPKMMKQVARRFAYQRKVKSALMDESFKQQLGTQFLTYAARAVLLFTWLKINP